MEVEWSVSTAQADAGESCIRKGFARKGGDASIILARIGGSGRGGEGAEGLGGLAGEVGEAKEDLKGKESKRKQLNQVPLKASLTGIGAIKRSKL